MKEKTQQKTKKTGIKDKPRDGTKRVEVRLSYSLRRGWHKTTPSDEAAAHLKQCLDNLLFALAERLTLPVGEDGICFIKASLPDSLSFWDADAVSVEFEKLTQKAVTNQWEWHTARVSNAELTVSFFTIALNDGAKKGTVALLETEKPPSAGLTPENAIEQLGAILAEIEQLQLPLRERYQAVLHALDGFTCGTLSDNAKLVQQLNSVRKLLGLALKYREDRSEYRVALRCAKTTRTKAGSFQLTTTTSDHRIVYTGTTIPLLHATDASRPK